MSDSVIYVENLVKRYKELIALDHFNLDIKKGEIFGLLGPMVPVKQPRLTVSWDFFPMIRVLSRFLAKILIKILPSSQKSVL